MMQMVAGNLTYAQRTGGLAVKDGLGACWVIVARVIVLEQLWLRTAVRVSTLSSVCESGDDHPTPSSLGSEEQR